MIELKHHVEVVQCPKCHRNVNLSIGKAYGGINDYGGWILRCCGCEEVFPYRVRNPNDYSSVQSGAEILAWWDDEIDGDKVEVYEQFGLNIEKEYNHDNVAVYTFGDKEPFLFDSQSECLFYCPACHKNLEDQAYVLLSNDIKVINDGLSAFLNPYLKGMVPKPDSIYVTRNISCGCGFKTVATFYRQFVEKEIFIDDIKELYIVDVDGADTPRDIDGIYSRDNCLQLLGKLLVRWQALFDHVLLVVPFIGFDFKNTESKRVELWNWILKHTLSYKTSIITRKATFNSFKEGAANQGTDIVMLKKYGLLNQSIEELSEKNALFLQKSHAKFYVGLTKDHVEVLVGSFNIHEGSYVENIHFSKYSFPEFFARYLLNLGIVFNRNDIRENGTALMMCIEDGEVKLNNVEKYVQSREEIVAKIRTYYR